MAINETTTETFVTLLVPASARLNGKVARSYTRNIVAGYSLNRDLVLPFYDHFMMRNWRLN